MKTLDLSSVTPSVGIIPQKDTVEHITSSYLEGVASLAKSMIPTSWFTGKLVILHGCVDSGTHPTRTLSAGAVFYNGEVYQVPAASFTTTGLQIGIWSLSDVNIGTESKLTDGSDVHVLVDNRFVFANGLSGSGLFDENSADIVRDFWSDPVEVSFNSGWGAGTGSGNFTGSLYVRKRGDGLKQLYGTFKKLGGGTSFVADILSDYAQNTNTNLTGLCNKNIGGYEAVYISSNSIIIAVDADANNTMYTVNILYY